MKIENYIEGAVSLIRGYKECEDFFYNLMIGSLFAFFVGWFFSFFNHYIGIWTMVMSSFILIISAVCYCIIRIIVDIKLKLAGEKVGTNGVR